MKQYASILLLFLCTVAVKVAAFRLIGFYRS